MIPPPRRSLRAMMIAVAVAAAAMRWPFAAILLAAALGGPIVGAWLEGRAGDDRAVAWAVFGGAGSYAAMAALLRIAARPWSSVVGPVGFALITAADALVHACAGMLVGALVGAVWVSLAPRRGR